jgi:hypothetical protein
MRGLRRLLPASTGDRAEDNVDYSCSNSKKAIETAVRKPHHPMQEKDELPSG